MLRLPRRMPGNPYQRICTSLLPSWDLIVLNHSYFLLTDVTQAPLGSIAPHRSVCSQHCTLHCCIFRCWYLRANSNWLGLKNIDRKLVTWYDGPTASNRLTILIYLFQGLRFRVQLIDQFVQHLLHLALCNCHCVCGWYWSLYCFLSGFTIKPLLWYSCMLYLL